MDQQVIEGLVESHRGERGGLITILEKIQSKYSYLPEPALRIVAEKTGHPIIVDDTVKRSITVNLRNRSSQEIIDNIVAAYGFAFREVDGICMISEGIPKKPSSYLLSEIDTISTQYVVASQAKSLFPVFLQDNVKTNMAQNAVVLSAPSQVLKSSARTLPSSMCLLPRS